MKPAPRSEAATSRAASGAPGARHKPRCPRRRLGQQDKMPSCLLLIFIFLKQRNAVWRPWVLFPLKTRELWPRAFSLITFRECLSRWARDRSPWGQTGRQRSPASLNVALFPRTAEVKRRAGSFWEPGLPVCTAWSPRKP